MPYNDQPIEPRPQLISQYLMLEGKICFVIPEYQRGYSWGISQCEQLLNDIKEFLYSKTNTPYFFGTVISVIDSTNGNRTLIDGQQRTTTFLLLLKALLLRLNDTIAAIKDDEETEALKEGLKESRDTVIKIIYKADVGELPGIRRGNYPDPQRVIIENRSINENFKGEVGKILGAATFEEAEKIVHKIPRKQRDNKYTNHFRNFKFFYKEIGDMGETEINAFAKEFLTRCQVIEIKSWNSEQAITMFNSLNSSGLPLADADIISAELYSRTSEEEKQQFNAIWESLIDLTDDLKNKKVVSIDSVLQQFMYYNRALHKDYVNENGSIDIVTPGLRRYFTGGNSRVGQNKLPTKSVEFAKNLLKIARTWKLIHNIPVVKLLLRFNENAKLYLSGYLYRIDENALSEERVAEISECLLRLFALLELDGAGYSSKKFKSFLFKAHIKIVDANCSIDEIRKDFDGHINMNWDPEKVQQELMEYDGYAMIYLNEYLYAKSISEKFVLEDSVNVEHIMPASGRNIKTIRTDARMSEEDFRAFVNTIGNKILLEDKINMSIGMEWFKSKKSGYMKSKYHQAQQLARYTKDSWEKEDIEKATEEAADRIMKFLFGGK